MTAEQAARAVEPGHQHEPVLRVVSGRPTPEEVAAMVTVLAARAGASQPSDVPSASTWASPRRAMRGGAAGAPGAWRTSALPL